MLDLYQQFLSSWRMAYFSSNRLRYCDVKKLELIVGVSNWYPYINN